MMLNAEVPAYLECTLNFVDVRDVARGHLLAADKGQVGDRYILGNENLKLSQLLTRISQTKRCIGAENLG